MKRNPTWSAPWNIAETNEADRRFCKRLAKERSDEQGNLICRLATLTICDLPQCQSILQYARFLNPSPQAARKSEQRRTAYFPDFRPHRKLARDQVSDRVTDVGSPRI